MNNVIFALILASHQGGRQDIIHLGKFGSLQLCVAAGKSAQAEQSNKGRQSASVCIQVQK
jgi:hypothetical protein